MVSKWPIMVTKHLPCVGSVEKTTLLLGNNDRSDCASQHSNNITLGSFPSRDQVISLNEINVLDLGARAGQSLQS